VIHRGDIGVGQAFNTYKQWILEQIIPEEKSSHVMLNKRLNIAEVLDIFNYIRKSLTLSPNGGFNLNLPHLCLALGVFNFPVYRFCNWLKSCHFEPINAKHIPDYIWCMKMQFWLHSIMDGTIYRNNIQSYIAYKMLGAKISNISENPAWNKSTCSSWHLYVLLVKWPNLVITSMNPFCRYAKILLDHLFWKICLYEKAKNIKTYS
jgi:hypothetical protein